MIASNASPWLEEWELEALDQAIESALDSGDQSGLDVLGYGEITSVLGWRGAAGRLACKRLPLFEDRPSAEAYAEQFSRYVGELERGGIEVVPSALELLPRADSRIAVYCLQPALPEVDLAPCFLAELDEESAESFFSALVERICSCVTPTLGLDGQLSNWAFMGDQLCYLDVTTPMVRDERGEELLDTELFLASIPWALRGLVRKFLLRQILDKYYDPRGVVVDLLGNLYKERLTEYLPLFIELSNEHVERPITRKEVEGYYRGDARTWAALQTMRRIDRAWQRHVRRRQYPFLLPGSIQR